MSIPETGTPGFGTRRNADPLRILKSDGLFLRGGIVVDGSSSRDPLNTGNVDVLRTGILLGLITATSLWAPSIIGTITEAHTGDTDTALELSAASATELNRRVGSSGTFNLTGPPTAGAAVVTSLITYSAVNTTTGVVTITAETTDFVSGSFVQPTDGSEDPLAIINDGTGRKVTDPDSANIDPPIGDPLIGGQIDSSVIVNWPSDAALRNWIMAKLNGGALATPAKGPFIFDHVFGF